MTLIKLHVVKNRLHHVWKSVAHILSLLILCLLSNSIGGAAARLDYYLLLLLHRLLPWLIEGPFFAQFDRSTFEIKLESDIALGSCLLIISIKSQEFLIFVAGKVEFFW